MPTPLMDFKFVPLLSLAAILAACSSPPPRKLEPPPPVVLAQRFLTSFDCDEAETVWQKYVCRDPVLAEADVRLHDAWVRQLPRQDQAGRAELLASQRLWQRGLYPRCKLEAVPAESEALPAESLSCLQQAWRQRSAVLQSLPPPIEVATPGPQQDHPLSAYVLFREAASLEPGLCKPAGSKFNELIAGHGALVLDRVPGWQTLASSRQPTLADTPVALPDGRKVQVQTHNSGPYGSYETRAIGLLLGAQPLIDQTTLPAWIIEQENAGGSFSATSSQTGDYANLDVFLQGQRVLVLVTQTWGYYASAARGEAPHAALYELDAQGLQRRCLWRSYVTPPVANRLRFLPQFKALQTLLDTLSGPDTMKLAPRDRHDAGLLYSQTQWEQLNMPLLGLREASLYARWPLLRQRHDEALETIFAWSERNVPSKQLYRRLMPLIPVAHAELLRGFQEGEGLKPTEAQAAADLMLMSALARAAERVQDSKQLRPAPVGAAYQARYAVVPRPGDLEQGRAYTSLHSALLNRAAPETIKQFFDYTVVSAGRAGNPALGLGPAGDTPLMASVRSPETLQGLILAGVDVNDRNAWGKTALMMAAQADQPDSVLHLLEAGADANIRTVYWQADGAGGLDNAEGAAPGRTALHHAAAAAQPAVIEVLMRHGAGLKAIDGDGLTPCDLLTRSERLQDTTRLQMQALLCTGSSYASPTQK